MASNQLGAKGLLADPNDPNSLSSGTAAAGTNGAPVAGGGVASPFAGQTANLAGGAAGVTQQPYGVALGQATKQYPFNPKYAAMDQALQRAIANAGFDRTNALSSLDQSYQQNTSEADRQEQLAVKGLTNKMFGQGIGFSGINLGAQSDLSNDYQRYVGQLGQQYAGGKASVENSYGRTIGDIAGQRETNYQNQAQEEQAAQLAAAQAKAEADARAQAAQQQAQLQQQLIAAQQASLAQSQANLGGGYGIQTPSIGAPSGGGGGNGGLAGFQGASDWSQIINLVNQSYSPQQLQSYWNMASTGNAPQEVLSAINSRFVNVSDAQRAGANQQGATGPNRGNSRAY